MATNKRIPKQIKVRLVKDYTIFRRTHYIIETKNHNRIEIFIYDDKDNIYVNNKEIKIKVLNED